MERVLALKGKLEMLSNTLEIRKQIAKSTATAAVKSKSDKNNVLVYKDAESDDEEMNEDSKSEQEESDQDEDEEIKEIDILKAKRRR